MGELYKSIEINGRKFRIKKFSARDGSFIVVKVAGLLAPMFEGVKWSNMANVKKPEDVDISQINIAQMFGKLTELKESDFGYLQEKCLRVCEEELKAGYTPVLADNGTFQTVTTTAAASAGATTIDVVSFTASAAFAIGVAVSNAETILEAVTACRSNNVNWYAGYAIGAADADVEAVSSFIQSATPASVYFYDTQDAAVLAGTTPNVMSTLQGNKASRSFGQYSTTAHAVVAAMGYAMGANTGLANSAFTMAYKPEVSVTPEVLTTTQATDILGWNGNIYTAYGNTYDLLVQGTMADGTPFDQILNLDILTTNIQTAVMNALTSGPKIPQTDSGVGILVNAVTGACRQAATAGILAPGIWNAAPVLNLQTGDTLSTGYLVQAATIASQTSAQIAARQAPPIYACVKMAGALEHVTIGVVVDL